MNTCLAATGYFDINQPQIRALAGELSAGRTDARDVAVSLYLWVRDNIRYNPYCFRAEPESFRASHCLAAGESYCIPKAVLLGSLARAAGIPARLGLADVRNHLSSPQLLTFLRTDVFVMHGYTELWLNGHWVKATPAFNRALCERMGVAVLAFDGEQDSVFQPFDQAGRRHMEYLRDHGSFADVPRALIVNRVAAAYPHLLKQMGGTLQGRSLEQDLS